MKRFKGMVKGLGLRLSPLLRAPWSPHVSGASMHPFFDPEDQLDVARQIAAMVVLEEHGRQRLYGDDLAPHEIAPQSAQEPATECDRVAGQLPEKWQRLLLEGAPRYTRSAEIGRFLMAVANPKVGWTWPMVREALTNPANGLSARVLEHPGDRLRWLEMEWDRTQKKVVQGPAFRSRNDALDEIDRLIVDAMASPRKVASQQLVYEHHLAIAKRLGTRRYRLSLRTQAQQTGYVLQTVRRANRALVKAGLLRRLDSEARGLGQATEWVVCPRSHQVLTPVEGNYLVTGRTQAGHDLWRHQKGLGKACFKLYRLLDRARPVEAKRLTEALGYCRTSTTYRHLRSLEGHGLLERWQGGWRRGSADLDLVALKLGVYGAGLRQREQHQEERTKYRESLKPVPCPGCGEVRQAVPRKALKPSLCRDCRAEARAKV